ncbi:VOC family protein [Ornithinimicrobium sp. Y1847]|uniref:VOC family protein n=1 Tax=unclassified Ornithinimicrobium TaxID=2615080 RepID=UPI003B66D7DE
MTNTPSTAPTGGELSGPMGRPIRFTHDIPGWQRIIQALGGTVISAHPGWLVYQLGSGRVALHAASEAQPPGMTFAIETPQPLAEAVEHAASRGVPITLEDSDHGPAGVFTAADAISGWLDSPTPVEVGNDQTDATQTNATQPPAGAATDPRLSCVQIWYGPDTAIPRGVAEGLGAQARLVSDNGTWTDLTLPGGGLIGIHAAETVGTELAFEWDGDVEDALALLEQARVEAMLIDETYSRTVQITDPDGLKAIWINERQTDLYGYRDASVDSADSSVS